MSERLTRALWIEGEAIEMDWTNEIAGCNAMCSDRALSVENRRDCGPRRLGLRAWKCIIGLAGMLLIASAGASPVGPAVPTVVCIDPGHPSEVGSGTSGRGISEISAAWMVALRLRTLLQSQGLRVVLTKTSERQFVKNRDRALIANLAHADYMVRLHCDANAGSGIASYAPDRQGVSGGRRGPSADVIRESQRMARLFHHSMVAALGGSIADRGLHSDMSTKVGASQGALTGSIYSEVPVVLIEMCVLTNRSDEAFIQSERGQAKLAQALDRGILAALGATAPRPDSPFPAAPYAPAPRPSAPRRSAARPGARRRAEHSAAGKGPASSWAPPPPPR